MKRYNSEIIILDNKDFKVKNFHIYDSEGFKILETIHYKNVYLNDYLIHFDDKYEDENYDINYKFYDKKEGETTKVIKRDIKNYVFFLYTNKKDNKNKSLLYTIENREKINIDNILENFSPFVECNIYKYHKIAEFFNENDLKKWLKNSYRFTLYSKSKCNYIEYFSLKIYLEDILESTLNKYESTKNMLKLNKFENLNNISIFFWKDIFDSIYNKEEDNDCLDFIKAVIKECNCFYKEYLLRKFCNEIFIDKQQVIKTNTEISEEIIQLNYSTLKYGGFS
ncbi:MAG TPA: hypothetical protein VIK86_03610 [Candidatus Paceibacterota bacterium]